MSGFNIIIIDPTHEKNIPIVVSLIRETFGDKSGILEPYKVYTLSTDEGITTEYVLTHMVFQFVKNELTASANQENLPISRIDVVEPTAIGSGSYGSVFPVKKSIIWQDGHYIFDLKPYVVKHIKRDKNPVFDKEGKPDKNSRDILRENYIASNIPALGVNYQLIHNGLNSFIHMNRAPGSHLGTFYNKLSLEQCLSLICTLLEEVPRQIQQIIQYGKHKGKTITHRDLKANNIMVDLVDETWIVTVIDYGLAKPMPAGDAFFTRRKRGNVHGYDGIMLNFLITKKGTLSFNAETDLYALYVAIARFAGARIKTGDTIEELIKELSAPDLTQLFTDMQIDAPMKAELTDLFRHMLHDNRAERATAAQALSGFKKALDTLRKSTLQKLKITPPSELISSAEDLKNIIECDLEAQIEKAFKRENKKNYESVVQEELTQWISTYRTHITSLKQNRSEFAQFKLLISRLDFKSKYIIDVIRLGLIEEYDDATAARLVIRHYKIAEDLLSSCPLPEQWKSWFDKIIKTIPLQLVDTDASFCKEISSFKLNLSDNGNISLGETLTQFLSTIYNTIENPNIKKLEESYPLIKVFNNLYLINKNIQLLKLSSTSANEWFKEIYLQALNKELPDDISIIFALRHELIEEIFEYENYKIGLADLYEDYEELEQTPLNLIRLNNIINNLPLSNSQELTDLFKDLNLLNKLNSVDSYLYADGSFLSDYDEIADVCAAKLSVILKNDSNNFEELKNEIENLYNYLYKLDVVDRFMLDIKEQLTGLEYKFLQKYLVMIMKNSEYIDKLAKIADANFQKKYYPKLRASLNTILEQQASMSSAHFEKLILEEISEYFADQVLYESCEKPMISNAQFQINSDPADGTNTINYSF